MSGSWVQAEERPFSFCGMQDAPTLRVARPTDDIDRLLPFYCDGIGLYVLYRFQDHDGFDGVMVGRSGAPYHFEFTRARGHVAGRATIPPGS